MAVPASSPSVMSLSASSRMLPVEVIPPLLTVKSLEDSTVRAPAPVATDSTTTFFAASVRSKSREIALLLRTMAFSVTVGSVPLMSMLSPLGRAISTSESASA